MRPLTSISPDDAAAAFRLAAECRDLGADASAWRQRLGEGARRLVRAQVAIVGEMRRFGEPDWQSLGITRVGWPDEASAKLWDDYANAAPVERKPEFPVVTSADDPQLTLTRDAIWGSKDAWYRSRAFNEVHRVCGLDDYIFSLHKPPGTDLTLSLWLHRTIDDPPFAERDRELVELVHRTAGEMLGGPLASGDEPAISDLNRRPREVLDLVLLGMSEKEIAAEMHLGRATVHEHVLTLYRHFGASSRGELMARFVGRARPLPAEPRA